MVVLGLEHLVLGFEVEQGTRGDRDDQLAVQGGGHAAILARFAALTA
jgi:hypothetical protein